MEMVNKKSRVLGVAFVLQAVTSLVSNAVFLGPLAASDDIVATMTATANSALQIRAGIVGEMITALGVVFLGAVLFATLRKQNEKMALVGLGFYVVEAGLLAASRLATFAFLSVSQESVLAGHPDYLQAVGKLVLESVDFGIKLHMLPFCLGAMLFYYLLYTSRVIPRGLSLWGMIALIPALIATVSGLFGFELPFYVYGPYIPFEFVVGVWIMVKGIKDGLETS